jgi:hypothetical protein
MKYLDLAIGVETLFRVPSGAWQALTWVGCDSEVLPVQQNLLRHRESNSTPLTFPSSCIGKALRRVFSVPVGLCVSLPRCGVFFSRPHCLNFHD